MCGIAGLIHRGKSSDIGSELTSMLQALKHRGPDSTGFALYGEPEENQYVIRFKVAEQEDMKQGFLNKRENLLSKYSTDFSDTKIEERLTFWKNRLEDSIKDGWSEDAKKYFIGKRLLKDLQGSIFGTKNISIWEHIMASEEEECVNATKLLKEIIEKI